MDEHIERYKTMDLHGLIGPQGKVWDVTYLFIPGRGHWYLIEETGLIFKNLLIKSLPISHEPIDPESDEYREALARIAALRLTNG